MTLSKRCDRLFAGPDRQRGRSYFNRGRVKVSDVGDFWIETMVSGTRRYRVKLDWSRAELEGMLAMSCSCPRFAGGFHCKHLWATILFMDRGGYKVPGRGRLKLESGARGRSSSPASAMPDWRRRLLEIRADLQVRGAVDAAPAKRHEVWYQLDLERSGRCGMLVIRLWRREEIKSGGMGRLLKLDLQRLPEKPLTDPEDREILKLLQAAGESPVEKGGDTTDYGYGYGLWVEPPGQEVALPPDLYAVFLPRLGATGRFGIWRGGEEPRALAWDSGPPWRFALRVGQPSEDDGRDRKDRFFLHGVLSRDGLAPTEVVTVLINGFVIFESRVARIDAPPGHWISFYFEPLVVARKELDPLLGELASMPSLPPVELPEDFHIQAEIAAPTPRLQLEPSSGSHFDAKLSFLYGEMEATADDPRTAHFDADTRQWVSRDAEIEAIRVNQFAELAGCSAAVAASGEMRWQVSRAALFEALRSLLEDGWEVSVQGRRWHRSGGSSLRVATGIDWVEVRGHVTFDEQEIPLPRLLQALRRGERILRLDDGSEGLLPEEWSARLESLAAMRPDKGETGALRFRMSQSLLLDALLGDQPEVDMDAAFQRLRERLQGAVGVAPRSEPRGFHGELRPYQRQGLGWLHFLEEVGLGGCLADDMGLGKTVQMLAHFQERRAGRRRRRPSLLVAPRSVVYNWLEEAARFAPRLRVAAYVGPERRALLEDFDEHDLLVTTYGTLRRDIAVLSECEFDYVVLDEAQAIKNAMSQTAKACRILRADHRLALTGTPVENHLGELWSLFDFLNPGMLGRLAKRRGAKPGDTTTGGAALPPEKIGRALRPFILRRTKDEVLSDLPPKTEQTLYCDLKGKQRALYDQLRDGFRASLDKRVAEQGLGRSKIHVLEALLRLRQAACHPALLDPSRDQEPSAKLDAFIRAIGKLSIGG